MRSHRIIQTKAKNKIDLSFLFLYITCVFRAFGGVSEPAILASFRPRANDDSKSRRIHLK